MQGWGKDSREYRQGLASRCGQSHTHGPTGGRVDQRSYPLWPPPDPDVPDYGIQLLGTLDSLRFQRTMHDLDLGQRTALEELVEPIPSDVTPLRPSA